jgi:putative sterol carrier protein
VAVFSSKSQATQLFDELFSILLSDAQFATELRQHKLSVSIVHSNPDFTLFLSPDGVLIDDAAAAPVITIKMSCDTAHALWMGKLLLPLAVATGKLRIRGSMAKVLEFAPMLQPAFDRYPALAATAGINA